MPHFLNRKESQLRSSDHIKKIAFPTAQGSYVAVLSVWELGLLSAKKIEYFDWKILRPLILAHCPCQRCNWEFVILVFHHLTKDYTALRGFCRSEVTTKSDWTDKLSPAFLSTNKTHVSVALNRNAFNTMNTQVYLYIPKVENNFLGQKEFHFGKPV